MFTYPGLPTRGRFLFKQQFYSYCSRHYFRKEFCDACKCGVWHNVYVLFLSGIIYKICPSVWRWWVNLYASTQLFIKITLLSFVAGFTLQYLFDFTYPKLAAYYVYEYISSLR